MVLAPPTWGAIVDDFWALHTGQDDPMNTDARNWCDRVTSQWDKDGVTVNRGKDVDAEEFAEVQGAEVDPKLHTLRLSWQKTNMLMRSALLIIT